MKNKLSLAVGLAVLSTPGFTRAQATYSYIGANGASWIRSSNWSGGVLNKSPGVDANTSTTVDGNVGDIAAFLSSSTVLNVGINFNTGTGSGNGANGAANQSLTLGAITFGNGGTAGNFLVGNNSTTLGGILTLTGVSVGGTTNVILQNSGANTLTIANVQGSGNKTMDLALSNATESIIGNTSTGGITVSSNITGANKALTINSSGTGVVTLSGANSYTGTTTVSAGTLSVSGSLSDTTDLKINGGTYDVAASDTVGSVTLTDGSISGIATLTSSTYSVKKGTVSAKLGGSGALTKSTADTVTLSGANTYTGLTTISGGTLSVTGTLSNSSSVNVSGGTYDVANTDTVSGVTLTDGIISGAGTLTGTSYDVRKGAVSAKLAGTGSLTKTTSDSVTLSEANIYTGTTTVAAGTLSLATTASITSNTTVQANAILQNNGTVTGTLQVNTGGTVQGNGTVTGAATINGILAPGNSTGLMSFGSSLVLASSTSNFEVDGTVRGTSTATLPALNGYDAVNVTGALTYDGILNVNLSNNTLPDGTQIDFFNFGSQSGTFDVVNLAGAYGTLTGIVPGANGWSATLGGTLFSFANSTGILTLSLSAVPEPLTAGGVLLLAGRLLGRRSRASM